MTGNLFEFKIIELGNSSSLKKSFLHFGRGRLDVKSRNISLNFATPGILSRRLNKLGIFDAIFGTQFFWLFGFLAKSQKRENDAL